MVDLIELERLADMVKNANIRKITLRQGDARITIRKGGASAPLVYEGEFAGDDYDDAEREASFASGDLEADNAETGPVFVTAPLVGVYHPAKSPVAVGVRVKAGQVIGKIIAMKLDNDVTTEAGGVVAEILVEDGAFVEYGQRLFAITPDE